MSFVADRTCPCGASDEEHIPDVVADGLTMMRCPDRWLDLTALTDNDRSYRFAPGPVEVNQLAWELNAALDLYRQRAPMRVLEVGSYAGGTLYHWLRHAQEGATVVSVDDHQTGVDNRGLYDGWAPDDVEVVAYAGDSHDPAIVAAAAEHGPFDWLFIDAGHAYPDVRADWENYTPMVAPGGVILLHDICLRRYYPDTNQHAGVHLLWNQIRQHGHVTQEIVRQPGQAEYGIGVVYV